MSEENNVPTCPGCHFGCALDDYQCARGEGIYESWQAGEEVPERRMPGPRGGKPGGGKRGRGGLPPFLNGNTAMGLWFLTGIMQRGLNGRIEQLGSSAVFKPIVQHEGAASLRIIASRAGLSEEAAFEQLQEAVEQGYVEEYEYADGTVFYRVTEAGSEAAQQAEEAKKETLEEYFSVISEEEQEQLLDLVKRVVDGNMRR